jgi:hypothetical protein
MAAIRAGIDVGKTHTTASRSTGAVVDCCPTRRQMRTSTLFRRVGDTAVGVVHGAPPARRSDDARFPGEPSAALPSGEHYGLRAFLADAFESAPGARRDRHRVVRTDLGGDGIGPVQGDAPASLGDDEDLRFVMAVGADPLALLSARPRQAEAVRIGQPRRPVAVLGDAVAHDRRQFRSSALQPGVQEGRLERLARG